MLKQFVPRLSSILSRSGSAIRLILVGRFISHWKQWNLELPLRLISLPLFDFQTVGQLVENFVLKSGLTSDAQYKNDFAAHLIYFTGGHPGCIIKILKQDFIFLPIEDVAANEDKYFETIVRPVVDEIREQIPDDLRKIFDTLSVLRRFSASLLKTIINKKLINCSEDEYKLERRLLQTYLVSRKDGFVQDDITRRLLSIHMLKTDLKHFLNVCETSVEFYESRLKDIKSHRPDILAVELFFQKLRYIYYNNLTDCKDNFFKEVPGILNVLVKGRDRGANLESLKGHLKEDWEFRFTFNYLLRKDIYDHKYPFNKLIKTIDDFMNNLQGDTDA